VCRYLYSRFKHLRPPQHRFLSETGQASVEFALILPLLLLVMFAIVEFARAYNAYNDLNQMAATGARYAAVNQYPGNARLISSEADTGVSQRATVTLTYLQNGVSGACVVGGSVRVTAQAPITLAPILKVGTINLTGRAEMRVERCPS
jgi:Flp pilus assembly protein TadG